MHIFARVFGTASFVFVLTNKVINSFLLTIPIFFIYSETKQGCYGFYGWDCGGAAALVGAIILGPRTGKYTKSGKVNAIPGHSITLSALGVFILWFGWFGFNGGLCIAG